MYDQIFKNNLDCPNKIVDIYKSNMDITKFLDFAGKHLPEQYEIFQKLPFKFAEDEYYLIASELSTLLSEHAINIFSKLNHMGNAIYFESYLYNELNSNLIIKYKNSIEYARKHFAKSMAYADRCRSLGDYYDRFDNNNSHNYYREYLAIYDEIVKPYRDELESIEKSYNPPVGSGGGSMNLNDGNTTIIVQSAKIFSDLKNIRSKLPDPNSILLASDFFCMGYCLSHSSSRYQYKAERFLQIALKMSQNLTSYQTYKNIIKNL